MGMINGSAIANVATTGTLTIPLMKKMAIKPDLLRLSKQLPPLEDNLLHQLWAPPDLSWPNI